MTPREIGGNRWRVPTSLKVDKTSYIVLRKKNSSETSVDEKISRENAFAAGVESIKTFFWSFKVFSNWKPRRLRYGVECHL